MYLVKEKSKTSLYKNYQPRFPKHKDTEIQAYVAYTVGNDISHKMQSTIRHMSRTIVREFFKEES